MMQRDGGTAAAGAKPGSRPSEKEGAGGIDAGHEEALLQDYDALMTAGAGFGGFLALTGGARTLSSNGDAAGHIQQGDSDAADVGAGLYGGQSMWGTEGGLFGEEEEGDVLVGALPLQQPLTSPPPPIGSPVRPGGTPTGTRAASTSPRPGRQPPAAILQTQQQQQTKKGSAAGGQQAAPPTQGAPNLAADGGQVVAGSRPSATAQLSKPPASYTPAGVAPASTLVSPKPSNGARQGHPATKADTEQGSCDSSRATSSEDDESSSSSSTTSSSRSSEPPERKLKHQSSKRIVADHRAGYRRVPAPGSSRKQGADKPEPSSR
jgi:hypothetical protein